MRSAPTTGIVPEWFQDFSEGMLFTSPARTIAEDDVRSYVRFSNDVRPVMNPAGGPVPIPPMFLFSLGVGLLLHSGGGYVPKHFVAFFGFDSIAFHRQAWAGETVVSTATVTAVQPRGRNGLVTYAHETSAVGGGVVASSTQRILVEREDGRG